MNNQNAKTVLEEIEGLILENSERKSAKEIVSGFVEYLKEDSPTDNSPLSKAMDRAWIKLIVERVGQNRKLDWEFKKEFRSHAGALMAETGDLVETVYYEALRLQADDPEVKPREAIVHGYRKVLVYNFPTLKDETREVIIAILEKISDRVHKEKLKPDEGQAIADIILETLSDIYL